jgi:signal transduction histidine kinase/DNA-binding response OmpR family regulator/streptogramin lyase
MKVTTFERTMSAPDKKYLFFLLLLIFSVKIVASEQKFLKSFLTVDNGLSHNEVTSIVQDHDGFIWIGTRGGLNRYDGYEFKVFNQAPGDSNSLVNPSIETLFVDSKGNIWIGTKSGGVSKYNPIRGTFKNIRFNYKQESAILPGNRIVSFNEDKSGRIFIGTNDNGLIIYDEETDSSKHFFAHRPVENIIKTSTENIWLTAGSNVYEYVPESDSLIRRNPVWNQIPNQDMHFDKKRNALWITSDNNYGLTRFSLDNYDLDYFRIGDKDNNPSDVVHAYESVWQDRNDKIWVGTWGTGFYSFDPVNEEFKRYPLYPENRPSFNKDYDAVLDIFQDRDNNIWLGTNGGGVCVLTPGVGFESVGYNPEPFKGLVNTRIMSVADDQNGNLWLGTIGSGIIWSPDRVNYYPVDYPEGVNNSFFFIIKYVYEDKNGRIWAGTNLGTFIIEFDNGRPRLMNARTAFPASGFVNWQQTVSFLDTDNLFWQGTLEAGLVLRDKQNGYAVIKHFLKDEEASGDLYSNRISYLLQDSKKRIWLGTYNGLHTFSFKDTTIRLAEDYFKISGDFTGNIITCLDEDGEGNIWVGTPNGLNKLTETSPGQFQVNYFTETDGLASNFIKGISHDDEGNIWVSTNTGISKLIVTGTENRFVNFDESDGVKGKNFTEASVFRNRQGEIFFGGTFGLTWFSPGDIHEYKESSKPIFTGLALFNQPVEPGKKFDSEVILSKSITHTNELELSYRQNNFEIEFSALDYKSMGRNKYKYLMENQDQDWNYIGTRRRVYFNNLRPGEYTLKVKSANSHNVWNENPAELSISVKPPFWQTWYAITFYVLLVIGIVLIIRWNAVKQVQLSKNLEMEKLQHAQDQRISEMKFQFFTNISHEFRTPLTLILAPIKEILGGETEKELPENVQHKLQVVQQNVKRLMRLINQLLDFRKAESGKMKLSARYSDIESFVNEVCFPFEELAKINEIDFSIQSRLKTKFIWFDREKLEIILNNLISNAFKFVKEKGKIRVSMYEEEEEILISVRDNGPGINPADLKHIFDRFYNVEKDRNFSSSGIGLALVKRLIEMHRGSVSVTSKPNENTEFVVALPTGKRHLTPEEITEHSEPEKSAQLYRDESALSAVIPTRFKKKRTTGARLLIVEDNVEMQDYIVSLLSPHFRVETAMNGAEGFEKALEIKPDLIISDVMMPKVDGFEFCKKIKGHIELATIPFILLTAKSASQYKLMGARHGADVYISKPFDPHFLLQNVENLLARQENLQKQFSKTVRLEPSDVEITPADEVFIKKIISTVEKNLQNTEFNSEVLASELNMSGSSLYRKLKTTTGTSPAEFIRTIRIKRAAQLLADKQRTITEIAYDVGFNDLKHFRTVFQKHFKCSPSEYREKL